MALANTHTTDLDRKDLVEITGPEAIELIASQVPGYPDASAARELLRTTKEIVEVKDGDGRELAITYARDVAAHSKDVSDHFKPFCDAAHSLHKAIVARRKEVVDALDAETKRLKDLVLTYDREQERKRREEEERIRREQEAAARAERERIEREAQEQAEKLAAEGRAAEAEAVIEQAVADVEAVQEQAASVVLPDHRPPAKVSGAASTKTWTIDEEAIDLEALVKAAAANPAAYLGYLLPNLTALRAAAKAQKSLFNVPGVKAIQKDGLRLSR
jgi:translation initiation factor 3 subunit A